MISRPALPTEDLSLIRLTGQSGTWMIRREGVWTHPGRASMTDEEVREGSYIVESDREFNALVGEGLEEMYQKLADWVRSRQGHLSAEEQGQYVESLLGGFASLEEDFESWWDGNGN